MLRFVIDDCLTDDELCEIRWSAPANVGLRGLASMRPGRSGNRTFKGKVMKGLVLAAIAALSFSAPLAAQDAPARLEIRGVFIGDTIEQVKTAHPAASCDKGDGVFSEIACTSRGFGNAGDAFIMYYIVGGKVESATVSFDAKYFSGISLALREKFGDPTKDTEEEVTNAMGAAFRNRKSYWITPGTLEAIQLEERSGKVTRSSVQLTSKAGMDASMARFKASKQVEAGKL